MTDSNNSPTSKSITTQTNTTLNKKGVVKLPGLHARLSNPARQAEVDPLTRPNRIALMLDASGSMGGKKNDALRQACQGFVSACNFADTALAIETFGAEPEIRVALTTQHPLLLMTVMSIPAHGGTPMSQAMDYVLNSYSITRGVIVSDGQPDSETAAYACAEAYKAGDIPIDTVHVSDGGGTSGEDVLRRIAEMTGGVFIKFTDIASFAKSFKYLTPAYYAQLTSGNASAAMLGAKDIK
jgi:Mg-chelatase subunit ChlD